MSLEDALQKLFAQAERDNPRRQLIGPRFENGRYRDCRWCQGRGCVSCKIECDKEYARQFPNGPQPIAVFQTDDAEQMEALKRGFHREVIEHAFGPDGGGMGEIMDRMGDEPCDAVE